MGEGTRDPSVASRMLSTYFFMQNESKGTKQKGIFLKLIESLPSMNEALVPFPLPYKSRSRGTHL